MKTAYFLLFIMILAGFSCTKNQEPDDELFSEIILLKGSEEYYKLASDRSPENSDPFELDSIIFSGDSVGITVSYPGGCKQHTFEIVWSGTLSDTEPPQTGMIIIHHANGDACEAYITETLFFNVSDLTDTICFDTLYVSVLNGWAPDDSTTAGGWDPADTVFYDDGVYDVIFTESDTCLVSVTAAQVICGAGLFNNLWFALDDSLDAGSPDFYFHKYLQPVAINESLEGFVPVQGQKYIIGASIQKEHDYLNTPVCLAYSGPSVPVRIMCIDELK
ncbi:MAG: hypothetical protein V1903_05770 [Bacteroidota bacterium]